VSDVKKFTRFKREDTTFFANDGNISSRDDHQTRISMTPSLRLFQAEIA